jgi:Spy/CpxP family protein refolding chaperone
MLWHRISLTSAIAALSFLGIVTTDQSLLAIPESSSSPFLLVQTPNNSRPCERSNKLGESLNLSESQKQQFKAIRQKYQSQMSQTRQTLVSEQKELDAMMLRSESDQAIQAQYEKVAKSKKELEQLAFNRRLEMRNVLTLEQRTKLSQMQQQRGEKYRNNRPSNRQDNLQNQLRSYEL